MVAKMNPVVVFYSARIQGFVPTQCDESTTKLMGAISSQHS